MATLFDAATATDVRARLSQLRPDSERGWGKMTPAQMLAHCSAGVELALGENRPKRLLIGRLLGPLVKRSLIVNQRAMRRNAPTDKSLLVTDDREFSVEAERLRALVHRFSAAGPAACTTHPHPFFGSLTPDEWGALMYVHLDHHLRQFGL